VLPVQHKIPSSDADYIPSVENGQAREKGESNGRFLPLDGRILSTHPAHLCSHAGLNSIPAKKLPLQDDPPIAEI
jgi:hypothetical protein